MTLQIIPMTAAHIDEVVQIQAEAFTPDLRETPEVFANRIARFGEFFRVAYQDGRMVGDVVAFPWKFGDAPVNNQKFPEDLPEPDCFFIHDIALLPDARGGGIARALLEDAYQTAHALGFDAASLVAVGQSGTYWDRVGFVPFARVTEAKRAYILDIYGPGARLMARPI